MTMGKTIYVDGGRVFIIRREAMHQNIDDNCLQEEKTISCACLENKIVPTKEKTVSTEQSTMEALSGRRVFFPKKGPERFTLVADPATTTLKATGEEGKIAGVFISDQFDPLRRGDFQNAVLI